MKIKVAVFVALSLAGLGCGEKRVSFTCDIRTVAVNTCTQASIGESSSAAYQQTCVAEGGKISVDPCSRSGYFGVCNNISTGGINGAVFSYPSSTVQTVTGAQTACANLGGTLTINPSFTPPSSCSNAGACVLFPNLAGVGPSGQSGAQQYCTSNSFGSLMSAPCTLSGVVGVCTYVGANASGVGGEVDIYATGSPSGNAQSCASLGGVWTGQ